MAKRKKQSPSLPGKPKGTIAALRREMEAIDDEILAAMNRRAELAQQVGELKKAEAVNVVDPEREAEVLAR